MGKMGREVMSIDDLQTVEVGKGIDVAEYEGQKAEIEAAEVVEVEQPYDPETNEFHEGGKFKVSKLRVYTKPVAEVEVEGKDGKKMVQIRASELFNLKYQDGKWGVSNSERSSLNKFLKKLKLPVGSEGVKKLGGQKVVMKIVTNNAGTDFCKALAL